MEVEAVKNISVIEILCSVQPSGADEEQLSG